MNKRKILEEKRRSVVEEMLEGISKEGMANYFDVFGLPVGAEEALPKKFLAALSRYEKAEKRLRKEMRALEDKYVLGKK